jgi:serine/threonine protein kinase
VIHRDLKSLNILVKENLDIKLCDFGISKFLPEADIAQTFVGTIYWLAPGKIDNNNNNKKKETTSPLPPNTNTDLPFFHGAEVGDHKYGFPVDVYSFAIIMVRRRELVFVFD